MKKILITGAAGFIGAHVVDYFLRQTPHTLILLDRLDTSGNLNRLKDLASFDSSRISFVWHDLKSPINQQVAKQIGVVDDVIHLAASSHVDRSIEDPLSFVMDNVVGTTNLLTWAKERGMRVRWLKDLNSISKTTKPGVDFVWEGKFINFSTDEVFGPAALGHNHKENEQHLPSNPYSASKSGQYAIGYSFWVTYGLPVITTYTMNNYGERQHPEKLVPKAITSIINGTEMPIFAELDGENLKAVGSRFWLHSWDTADAINFILNNGVAGESYNIVGTDELTNLEVCETIAEVIQKPLIPKFIDFHAARPGHDRRYALDGSKLAAMGWKPTMTFKEGMKRTVEWYLDPQNSHWL